MSQTGYVNGLGFPESTRCRDGHVGSGLGCLRGAGRDQRRAPETVARIAAQAIPFSMDWLPDGRMVVIDGPRQLLLGEGSIGSLDVADLTSFGGPLQRTGGRRRRQRLHQRQPRRRGPRGAGRERAPGRRRTQWPNGMALIDDDDTLVVADSHAEQLVGFDVGDDGSLSGRRV